MAQQILTQATAILQRVNALAQQAQAPSTYGFLQASGASQMQAVSSAAVESLSSLQTRYATLIAACDKAETQANLDLEDFGRASQALQETLARTHNYKTSVRLQGMSGLDQDTEDEAALKTQLQSVTEYVSRLRTSCAGILQHYDERRQLPRRPRLPRRRRLLLSRSKASGPRLLLRRRRPFRRRRPRPRRCRRRRPRRTMRVRRRSSRTSRAWRSCRPRRPRRAWALECCAPSRLRSGSAHRTRQS